MQLRAQQHENLGTIGWNLADMLYAAKGTDVKVAITVRNPTSASRLYAVSEWWVSTIVQTAGLNRQVLRVAGFERFLPMWPGGADGGYVEPRGSYVGNITISAPEPGRYSYVTRLHVHPDYWMASQWIDELMATFTAQQPNGDSSGIISMILPLMMMSMMMSMMTSMTSSMKGLFEEEE